MIALKEILEHPLTRGLPVDDPRTTLLRREIIRDKPFLHQLYLEWYERIVRALHGKTDVLELGSGAGFFRQILPGAITSEVFLVPGISLVADACALPLADASLNAIVMTDVFHHIPDVRRFLAEAARCVRRGGQLIMIEPWRTHWSDWVYRKLHAEPFVPDGEWKIPSTGPLSGANGALPWIVFQRDRIHFQEQFPQWHIETIEPMMPFSYLLSGGVSMRAFLPGCMYGPVRTFEEFFDQAKWAMFAFIELVRGA